ncbi:QcrA and Rieske domain-containing protein [Adhaeribacter soli]|uniref:Rieske domain-containing protein n=1 Tax=Adhaeribacter soli TaxID=2607655 RepID=A0A5N1IID1_9BACT|nr:hypothetical protein [Adhaeribacter soli]KAA9325039.1 hypothetical protein F0P94_19225 [Adhaeribacter soli]
MITRVKTFLLLLVPFLAACSKDSEQRPQYLPEVIVNEQINLTNQQYNSLQRDYGFVSIPGGIRGIIIVRHSANRYLAFERNCTYQPYDSCATVKVDQSSLFLSDPCCGSRFDFEGGIISGPAAYPLKQYATSLSGNMLYISN